MLPKKVRVPFLLSKALTVVLSPKVLRSKAYFLSYYVERGFDREPGGLAWVICARGGSRNVLNRMLPITESAENPPVLCPSILRPVREFSWRNNVSVTSSLPCSVSNAMHGQWSKD